jgi:ABC-2 type transport system ATP-binding protein
VLDEPTNGLDPQGIAEVRDLIRAIADNERTIILASHLLDEVEKVCSHVAVMQQGQLLQSGKVADLLSDQPRIELSAPDLTLLRQKLDKLPVVQQVDFENSRVIATVDTGVSPGQLNQKLYEQGIVIDHLAMRPQNLEEQFLSLTQSSA